METGTLKREDQIARLTEPGAVWDFLVVGGGATGLGVAVDAASRGHRVALVDRHDFCKGTSSRSTKLVHGGVRYLQQGNVSLVLEALRERGIMRENAPHLVRNLPFVVPNYEWWEAPFYGIGLRLYDLLAGRYGFGRSRNLTREQTLERIPTVETDGLRGGVIYYDGQFDDARLGINLMQTAIEHGACCVNYAGVVSLLKSSDGMVEGAVVRDYETGNEYSVPARAVINATGPFVDILRKMDEPEVPRMIRPSQGVHIVLEKRFLPRDSAIMVPHTDDGRVLFAIPWLDRVVVGTTDTPVSDVSDEPLPMKDEIDFLLEHAARYLAEDPSEDDILSVFAGIRPLVDAGEGSTASLSRDHTLHISRSGLVTITGGKWTTYRKMAEDTVDQAEAVAQVEPAPCVTKTLRIHGYAEPASALAPEESYGSDALELRNLTARRPELCRKLHPRLPVTAAQVIWAVRHEMARTVEDVLARRTRALLLDARAAREAAEPAAALMAAELNRDQGWQEQQIREFSALAERYLPSGY